MKTIAVLSPNRGSGKTTLAVNLAAFIADIDHRVMLVDQSGCAGAKDWSDVQSENSARFHIPCLFSPDYLDAVMPSIASVCD